MPDFTLAAVLRPRTVRVLVVEDDADIRELLVQTLEEEGYQASFASNGLEALQALRDGPDRPPHLILLDFYMPIMDGGEFLELIEADPRLCEIPVVMITAATNPPRRPRMTIIRKPFNVARLLHAVRSVFDASSAL